MRHRRLTHRLGRSLGERRAMLENMVTSLLRHQEIRTTLPKAREARKLADRVISLGKVDTLSARRQVNATLGDHALTSKLFREIAPRFAKRNGGYTRILRLERRRGDGAPMAFLELTEKEILVKEAPKPKGKKEKKPAPPHPEEPKREPKQALPKGPVPGEKEAHPAKHPEPKKEKPKKGFFQNISRFFRNKGGG